MCTHTHTQTHTPTHIPGWYRNSFIKMYKSVSFLSQQRDSAGRSHSDEQTEPNEVKQRDWGGFHGDSSIPPAHRGDYPAILSASTSCAQIRKQMQLKNVEHEEEDGERDQFPARRRCSLFSQAELI